MLNAETVLRIAQIAQRGPAWFRSFGTFEEPGPRLVSIDGAVFAAGIVETAAGVAVEALVRAAGGATVPGPGVIPYAARPARDQIAPEASSGVNHPPLSPPTPTPDTGPVLVLGGDGCPLAHVSDVLAYAAGESAGQCGPCMFGISALAEDMRLLAHCCLDRVGVQRLGRRLGLLPGRGACRFPDGVAGYARSALRVFAGEVSSHLGGTCTSEAASRSSHVVWV